MTKSLVDIQRHISEEIRKEVEPPKPDPFDIEKYPFGKAPGANKMGLEVCATCGKPPTETGRNDCPLAFMFEDDLSAKEYYISAMCQACQNSVFK